MEGSVVRPRTLLVVFPRIIVRITQIGVQGGGLFVVRVRVHVPGRIERLESVLQPEVTYGCDQNLLEFWNGT